MKMFKWVTTVKDLLTKVNSKQKNGLICPTWVVWTVAVVWGYVVFRNYYSIFKPDLHNLKVILPIGQYLGIFNLSNFLIFKHFFSILLTVIFLFSAFAIGRIALKRFLIIWHNFLEEIVFSVGLGLGIIAYLIFLIGVLGLLYRLPIIAAVVLFSIIGIIDLKKNPVKFIFPKDKIFIIDILALIILIVAVFLNLAGALSPELFYDSLVYHLGVPNYYMLNHKIVDMPYIFLSNLPMVHGMLFTAGLFLKDEITAKLINYFMNVFCCITIISVSLRYFKLKVGIWASLIFYTIIYIMIGSWFCGTEACLAFFSMLSVYAIMNYTTDKKIWLIFAGIFAGLSMAVKYSGFFVMLGIIISHLSVKGFISLKNVRSMIILGLISMAIVAPWLIKSYIYKRNPVYPYFNSVFPRDKNSDYDKLNGFIAEAKQSGSFNLKNWLKHPWDITMGRVPNSKKFTPIFLFIIPILFFIRLPHPIIKYGIIYSLVIWLCWSFSTTMIRFMVFVFPIAGLVIAAYLTQDNINKVLKQFLLSVILIVCAISVYWFTEIYYIQGGWKVISGLESKSNYLSASHLSFPFGYCGYYAAAEFTNDNLPQNSKILFIGDARSYYFKRPIVVSSAHDLTPIVEWAKESDSAAALYRTIRKEGITHIYFNLGEAVRLGRSYRMFEWDEKSLSVYNDFWKKYVKEIFYKDEIINGNFANRVAVYEILSEKDAVIPTVPPFNLMPAIVVKNINSPK